MRKAIGTVIAEKRREKKMSQIDLANALLRYGIHVQNAAVSAWENNNNVPTAAQLLAICEILSITDIYGAFIGEVPDRPAHPFDSLNDLGIQKAQEYLELLRTSDQYRDRSAERPGLGRRMKISLLSTSAGTGDYLDEENFEEVDVFTPVPAHADFGVYLNGDSMEPTFKNDELVWIMQTNELHTGEIGLFFLNGMTYFKKLIVNKKGTFLFSLNSKYKPILIKDTDDFRVFGKLTV